MSRSLNSLSTAETNNAMTINVYKDFQIFIKALLVFYKSIIDTKMIVEKVHLTEIASLS